MGDRLRNRVRERLDAKGLNPFEAARMAGFERSFLNDLLIGKKQTVRESKLQALASVLDCDPDYLIGRQDMPRTARGAALSRTGMVISGICEAGAWREPGYQIPNFGPLPIESDPRYLRDDQKAFLVRGDHAAGLGILDGSVVCTVSPNALSDAGRKIHNGDVVLVAQSDESGRSELTVRTYEDTPDGVRLRAKPSQGELADLEPGPRIEVVGVVLRAIRVFGLPV